MSPFSGRRAALAILAFSVLGGRAAGDERYQIFLERSYFFPGAGILSHRVLGAPAYYTEENRAADDDEVLFEAQPAPHIFLFNNVSYLDVQRGAGWRRPRVAASFVFLTRVRNLGGFSSPLRNPSFMPRFTTQLLWFHKWPPRGENPGTIKGTLLVHGLELVPWGHHSNGGPGCLFLEDRETDGKCGSNLRPEAATVNTRTGSFSTNYVRIGYSALLGKIDKPAAIRHSFRWSGSLGASLELNPKGWGPGALDDRQGPIYGRTRFKVHAELQRRVLLGRLPTALVAAPSYEHIRFDKKPFPSATPHRLIADLMWINQKEGAWFRGWGLAARFYRGQDYHNLLFVRDVRRLQVGFVYDPATRLFTEPAP